MSKNIEITSEVTCANENTSDIPSQFVIEIDESLLSHVKKLANTVSTLGVHMIESFNTAGDWGDEDGGEYRLDCKTIQVSEKSFRFTCFPKHGGDDELLRTEQIYIEAIENAMTGNESLDAPKDELSLVTAVVIDKANNKPSMTGVYEPLIYDVEVGDPEDMDQVAKAVAIARGDDLGQDIAPDTIIPQFAIPSGMDLVVDWRTG